MTLNDPHYRNSSNQMLKYPPLGIVLAIVLATSVSCFNIRPLRSATIQIEDKDIRSQLRFQLKLDLEMKREFYEARKDINVVASITSLAMDDQLSFYFDYKIFCPQQDCFLNFTFVRYTEEVNPDFEYSLTVDYLVARGLRIMELNMTSYQEHLEPGRIVSYDENNQRQVLGDVIPYNNYDALRLLLFPNGWSNVTRSGRVMHLFAMGADMYMYVVHYMEKTSLSGHDEGDAMGWPEAVDFIKYKIVFFDYDYRPAEDCKVDDKFVLEKNYEKTCENGGNDLKWFFGFKRTRETQIKGQFFESKAGYSFDLRQESAYYGVQGFPFKATDEFVDLRVHQYRYSNSQLLAYALEIVIILGILIAAVSWLQSWRKEKKERRERDRHEMDVLEGDSSRESDGSLTPAFQIKTISLDDGMK